MANLRQLQKESTRKRLLATALRLFETRGYTATTIDDIAAAAGTTRVTFYAHFDSRRGLMLALIHELNGHLDRRETAGGRVAACSLIEAVRAGTAVAIGFWLRAQAVRWPTIKPYMLAATEASAIDPEVRQLFGEWFEEVISDIEEGLTRAERFAPETRRFRGELALAQLDHTALQWMREAWDLDSHPALDVLTASWTGLLGEP